MAERVAYLLKGYPRISELFIASEIHRLEQLGVPISLYVIKAPDEALRHDVVDRIIAVPRRLPAVASLSGVSLPRWLRHNFRPFIAPLRRTARRYPVGIVRAAAAAFTQAVRARSGWHPKTIYAKELLQAVALAAAIDADGGTDHIHAHFAHGTTTVAWLTSKITGVPFSFTGHAKDIYRESLNPAGLLERKMNEARFVATCTGANVEHLRSVAPSADLHLVYHGLNADFTRLLDEAPPRRTSGHLRIVSVGRQVPKKGFDILLDAVSRLVQRGLEVELETAGEDGPEHHHLVAQRDRLGLRDIVHFRGVVTQRELLALYRRSTVFALACRVDESGDRDGIPNVLVEAMASGMPVVSTAVSGIPEVISHGENGLLVPEADPAALAEALHRIAKDPDLADHLAKGAAQTVATRFDGDQLAATMASLFSRSCS